VSEAHQVLPVHGEGDHAQQGGGGPPPAPRRPSAPSVSPAGCHLPASGEDQIPLDHRADFPAIPPGWAYLDTAATAQKPRAVIDAITRGYAETYATVHRGVYQRSADMTLAYEGARRRTARFLGAASADEIVFVRGATEGINLVAQSCFGNRDSPHCLRPGDRIMLSQLEHHSNIVPWQLIAERTGAVIDVAPLTEDHRIDLDAMAGMLTDRHRIVALAHVSNVLGAVLDARRAAELAHDVGALLLLDGCQAVPRMAVDVAALGCDFYVFSAHKLYGPTGIGVLWGRSALLNDMPPWQGGGAMIDKVSFDRTTYAPPPARFEAGTPHIVGALGLHAAIDYVDAVGLGRIAAHEAALVRAAREALGRLNSIRLFGPEESAGIVSFAWQGVHPHDIGTILDEEQVAIRAGHHCAQPLMATLGVDATARASFGVYNEEGDVEALVRGLERVRKIFG
jgi:cysteine desulfurase / selenocysteine lyase